jgi:hypothetical protein
MIRKVKDTDLDNVYTAKTLARELNVSERQIHYYRENNQLQSEVKEAVIEFLVSKWGYEYEA